jgi:hypothetical protein
MSFGLHAVYNFVLIIYTEGYIQINMKPDVNVRYIVCWIRPTEMSCLSLYAYFIAIAEGRIADAEEWWCWKYDNFKKAIFWLKSIYKLVFKIFYNSCNPNNISRHCVGIANVYQTTFRLSRSQLHGPTGKSGFMHSGAQAATSVFSLPLLQNIPWPNCHSD